MKIANRMMIGNGMPINQSSNPRPNPMTSSYVFVCQIYNAGRRPMFQILERLDLNEELLGV
jgi:hypothetical protein